MIETAIKHVSPNKADARVLVEIPCKAEYVAIARLAALGIANHLSFSYDEVEDIRLAVGEACTHAVERALVAQPQDTDFRISIESIIEDEGLTIIVQDNVPPGIADNLSLKEGSVEVALDRQDLGAVLIEILVDEVSVTSDTNGTSIRLFKQTSLKK